MSEEMGHEGREAKRTMSAKGYVPLQDRMFLGVTAVLACGLVASALLMHARMEHVRMEQEVRVARTLVDWERLAPVARPSLGPVCGSIHPLCRFTSNGKDAVALIEGDRAWVLPQARIDSILGAPSAPTRLVLTAAAIGLLLSLAIRALLHRYVFRGLDIMTRVIFARRVFAKTGGVAQDASGRVFDGRHHVFQFDKGSLQTWLNSITGIWGRRGETMPPFRIRKGIQIVTRPEPPPMPLDRFEHDELGQLASALEDAHARELRWGRLLQDFIESLPLPVAAFSKDGRIIHLNQKFLERTDAHVPRIDSEPVSADILQRNHLHFPDELTQIVLRILEQSHPRVFAREFKFTLHGQTESLTVSVSTLSRLGKRIAVVVLHENSSRDSSLSEVISGLASRQIDMVQAIADQAIQPSPLSQLTILRKCELLKDQINTLFDFIHQDTAQNTADNIEFNLHALLHSLQESSAHTHPFELAVESGVPVHVFGNPMHLRQYCLAVLNEYFGQNRGPARIAVTFSCETSDTTVSVRGTGDFKTISHPAHTSFLHRLAKSYSYRVLSNGDKKNSEYFIFNFATVQAAAHKQTFTWLDTQTPLDDKIILVCVGHPVTDEDTLEICRKIPARHVEESSLAELPQHMLTGASFDAAVLIPGQGHWQSDPEVLRTVALLRKRAIPVMLLPPSPRRGDSADAQKAGFSAYLRSPASLRELENLLQILCSKEVLSDLLPHGLITRHLVQDLADEFGSCLIADLEREHRSVSEKLEQTLISMALRVVRKQSRAEFFEALYTERFSHVFYPSQLSLGFRRQLAMAVRGKTAICFAVNQESASRQIPMIRNPESTEDVLQALQSAHRSHSLLDQIVEEEEPPEALVS